MFSNRGRGRSVRQLKAAGRAAAIAATLSLGACAQMGDLGLNIGAKDAEESVADAPKGPQSELHKATAYWGKQAQENPKDTKAVINYAKNLKAQGRKQEALAALQAAYMFHSDKTDFLSEYGRLSLDLGQVGTAAALLERADDPMKPDWRVISGRGVAMAKQGQYREAIPLFERAIELAPQQASLKNNLAMAYTMDGQAQKGEELLRQASSGGASDPRVKQNLALVLGLQGKHGEAKTVSGEGETGEGVAQAPPQPSEAASTSAEVASPKQSPASPVTTASVSGDDIIRSAMEAEAVKHKQAAKASAKRKSQATASYDEAPVPKLKPTAR